MKDKIEETHEIYRLVGFALTKWGSVERDLCSVFCNCINPHQANPADKAFWSILSFEGKLNATGNVLEDQFPKFDSGKNDDPLKSWSNTYNRLKKHNTTRNKLAHGSGHVHSWNDDKGHHSDAFLAPYHHSRSSHVLSMREMTDRNGDSRPIERFYAKDIIAMTRLFSEDGRRLRQLADDVRERLIHQGFLVGLS